MVQQVEVNLLHLFTTHTAQLILSTSRVIHEPDENDNKLFRLLFIHYDTAVHQRLVTLHQYKPKYGVGSLVDCGVKLRSALRELIQMTQAVRNPWE